MAGRLVEVVGWLATQVFDVVGSVAGAQGGGDGDTIDLQVGKVVFNDVPAKMRSELWLSQLHRRSANGSAPHAGEYYDLLFEKLSPDVLSEIDKDTHRTFPGDTWLSSPAGQKALLNVLRAYALSDPEIGYTQGMNFLAAMLLAYLPSEPDAYAALSLLMWQRGLRELYLPDMSLLQIRLWQLSKLLPPRLAAHLEAHAALPVLYASSWLLTCFAADFPIHFAARVVDVLMAGQAAASPMLKVAVGIVSRCEAALLRLDDLEDIVCYLRQEVPRWSKATLQDLLTEALSKPWTPRQLRVLDQINGAETVMEAVNRVNRLASQVTSESAEAPLAARQGGADDGPAQLQGEARVQLTPRTMARGLSSSFTLPRGPGGAVLPAAWSSWRETPCLDTLEAQQVRIDLSIGDGVQLDPQLSQALSAYTSPAASSRGASFTAAAATATAAAASPQRPAPRQQRQRQQAEGGGAAGEPHTRWDTFAHQSGMHLRGSPSPFNESPSGGGAAPPGSPLPAPQDGQPSAAGAPPTAPAAASPAADVGTERSAAAAAPGADAAAAGVGRSPSGAGTPAAGDSFGMRSLHSSAPLVDLERREQPGAGPEGSAASKPLQSFLSLFSRDSNQSSQGGASRGNSGGNLLQDAPSSHGSSLAAVLHALSLNASWASGPHDDAAPGSVGGDAAAGSRRLRHSGEGEEWSSFKTGAGSEHGSEGADGMASGLSGVPSWHSVTQHGHQISALASDGSSTLPPPPQQPRPQQPPAQPPHHDPRTPVRQLSTMASSGAGSQASQRLSSEMAGRRAASLQEEHLQRFVKSSSKGDRSCE